MKDFLSSATPDARVSRGIRGSGRINGRPRELVVHPPDAMADIYSHLRWIGPGTFLVAAYMHKRMRG